MVDDCVLNEEEEEVVLFVPVKFCHLFKPVD